MATVTSFTTHRLQKVGYGPRLPGQLCPEAHTWFLVESLVHSGFITRVNISVDELRDAVAEFCPNLATQIGESVGQDFSDLQGDAHPPPDWNTDVLAAEVARGPVLRPQDITNPTTNDDNPRFPRGELEAMDWDDLRELAMEHPDLNGNSARKLIIDTLAEE